MHKANAMMWAYFAEKYPRWFKGPIRVAEFGSYDVNGSIRQFFDVAEYVGIDWRPGPCVDLVALAHEVKLPKGINTIVSASMLEHDPHWFLSLRRMYDHLAEDGAMFISWGAALNPPHELYTAPDGLFHCLPAERVLIWLKGLGLHVHEFRYEYRLPFLDDEARRKLCMGCVGVAAFKRREDAEGEPILDDMLEEDKR